MNDQSRAFIQVRVPNNAEVYFEGDRTSQTGTQRSFISPAPQLGKTFTYDIRARWMDPSGRPVEQTRHVKVQAGRRSVVDFTNMANTGTGANVIDRPIDNRDTIRDSRPLDNRTDPNRNDTVKPNRNDTTNPNRNELPLPKQPKVSFMTSGVRTSGRTPFFVCRRAVAAW